VAVSAASWSVLTNATPYMTIGYDEEVEMPVLRRLDLRSGSTRGIGRPPCYDLGAQSVTAATFTVQLDATGVAKVEVI
jgi:hypothetical protein